MVIEAVDDDDKESKDEEDVGCHWDVGQILEWSEPADRNQDERCNEDVEAFDVTLVVESLKADHLIHLLANKDQVSYAKANLWTQYVKVDELATLLSKDLLS